jgi:hypothetical protein
MRHHDRNTSASFGRQRHPRKRDCHYLPKSVASECTFPKASSFSPDFERVSESLPASDEHENQSGVKR